MNIDEHWKRFVERYRKQFDPVAPKNFAGQFEKDGKLYRMQIECYTVKPVLSSETIEEKTF